MRSRSFYFLLVLGMLGLLSVSTGCRKTAADPLPASGAVSGWAKTSDTRTFAAKDLWQYIDGDAEQYVAAGVVSTVTSDYKYNGQIEAVVDVHTMKEPGGAHKMLTGEQSAQGKAVQVGDEAIQSAQSLSFRKGATLVRIVSYQAKPETSGALLSLGRAIAGKL